MGSRPLEPERALPREPVSCGVGVRFPGERLQGDRGGSSVEPCSRLPARCGGSPRLTGGAARRWVAASILARASGRAGVRSAAGERASGRRGERAAVCRQGAPARPPPRPAAAAWKMSQERPTFYRQELNKTIWEVPERYQNLSPVGSGAYGSVW